MKTDYIMNGTYPELSTKPCTTGTSKDGTPINSALTTEPLGFAQACTYQGNITPSESVESYSNSDVLNGIRNCCGTPGEIVYSGINPDKILELGARLLPASGQNVEIDLYQLLFDYCYVGDDNNNTANAFYRCHLNGTRTTTGAYINIPDLRHVFVRGWNTGVSEFGHMEDSIRKHRHTMISPGGFGSSYIARAYLGKEGTGDSKKILLFEESGGAPYVYAQDHTEYNSSSETWESNSGSETRPECVSVRAYIRY